MNRQYPQRLLAMVAALLFSSSVNAADWPQWRGPNRDGHSPDTGLLKEWPDGGPAAAWQVESVGVGYSSIVIAGGRVVTLGDLDGIEHIICLSEKDGSLVWAVQPEPVRLALEERVAQDFQRADRNGDGKLDQIESMSGLGWNFNRIDAESEGDVQEIAAARTKKLLAALDADKDGRLTYDEAPGAMQGEFNRIDQQDDSADVAALAQRRAAALLKQVDKDGDGKVSKDESRGSLLQRTFNSMDERDPDTNKGDELLTLDEISAYFAQREAGRDGVLTAEELAGYFAREFPRRDGVLSKQDLYRQHGGYRNGRGDGPRGTPTIDGERVYAEGGNGDLSCLDLATGKTVWHVNLSQDLGGGRPGWGYSESPLVTEALVIVTPGGKNGTLAALDKETGEVVWRSTAVTEGAHYASPQVAKIGGVEQIVQFARNNVFGVSMDGNHLLWAYSGANNGTANCSTPIIAGDYVLASSAYGTGTGMVKVSTTTSNEQQAEEVYFQKRVASHHGGLVKVGDYVYTLDGGLNCIDFMTGQLAWKDRSVSKGSILYADGMLYCLGERQEVALVEANPKEYVERGRFKIESHGLPSWAHPAVANGRLYIRDQQSLTAYDIRAK